MKYKALFILVCLTWSIIAQEDLPFSIIAEKEVKIQEQSQVQQPTFNIGTKWTYEIQVYPSLEITYKEFEIVDTTFWEGRLAYVIEPGRQDARDYIAQEGSKIYYWIRDLNAYQLQYDFEETDSYETIVKGPNNTLDTVVIKVDSIGTEIYNGKEYEVQYLDHTYIYWNRPIIVIKNVGRADTDFRLQINDLFETFSRRRLGIRCFEQDTTYYNFAGIACDSFWQTLSTVELALEPLQIYPNPSTGRIHIQSIQKDVPFQIFDLQGKLHQKGITQNQCIELTTQGIFNVHLWINEKWRSERIVILK